MLDKVQEAIDKREVSSIIPLKIQKLTKKQLMELEQGRYLVSHAVDEFGNPIFAQEIPSGCLGLIAFHPLMIEKISG